MCVAAELLDTAENVSLYQTPLYPEPAEITVMLSPAHIPLFWTVTKIMILILPPVPVVTMLHSEKGHKIKDKRKTLHSSVVTNEPGLDKRSQPSLLHL